MKKVTVAIALALVFISGVLIYLMVSGVHLQERRMVKWSQVESPQAAGEKIAAFMYPLVQQKQKVVFVGEGPFVESFFRSYADKAKQLSKKAEILLNPSEPMNAFEVQIMDISNEHISSLCKEQGLREYCIANKALVRYQSKERDPNSFWINMYRMTEDKALFFYYHPSQD